MPPQDPEQQQLRRTWYSCQRRSSTRPSWRPTGVMRRSALSERSTRRYSDLQAGRWQARVRGVEGGWGREA